MINLKERRILVTGAHGFLGRYVVEQLAFVGVDCYTPSHDDYDLSYERDVERMYDYYGPEIVIHLAAECGGIAANKKQPASFFYNNLMMGTQLMNAAYHTGVEKFVAIGTVCSYPKHCPIPFKEEDIWNGYPEETNAPYGLAKKMMLVQSQAYRDQFGFNSIFLIPVNMYGRNDNFDSHSSHVIPAIIKKCVKAVKEGHKNIYLWGSGTASREFIHASEAARAIVLATEKYDSSEPVNIGTGSEITIKCLAYTIADICGFTGDIVWQGQDIDGQPRRRLDISKAKKYFGFDSKILISDGLRDTVKWYKEQL